MTLTRRHITLGEATLTTLSDGGPSFRAGPVFRVLAFGCTIGQGASAFSVLSFSAPVTFAAISAAAAIGLRQLITGFA